MPVQDDLVHVLGTMANPQRMRVLATLAGKRGRVGQLARALGISRVLVRAHLRKLEAAGLVSASVEPSPGGEATTVYEVAPFAFHLTPQSLARRCAGADRVRQQVPGPPSGNSAIQD